MIALLVATRLFSAPALAQDEVYGGALPGLNAQAYRPSVDSTSFLWLTDSSLLSDRAFFARAGVDYARNALVYTPYDYGDGGEKVPLIKHLAQLDLAVGYTFGRFRAALIAPVILRAAGDAGSATGLGDLTLDAKVNLLDRAEKPLGLALSGRLSAPTGTTGLSLSNEGLGYELELAADREVGPMLVALNLGHRGQPQVSLENTTWGSQVYGRLGGAVAIDDLTGVALEVNGALTYAALGDPAATPVEVLLTGWRQPVADVPFILSGGIGVGATKAVGAPSVRFVLSGSWVPGGREQADMDNDGIGDRTDQCPANPEDIDGARDKDGCPELVEVFVQVVDQFGTPVEGGAWRSGVFSGKSGGSVMVRGNLFEGTATAPKHQAGTLFQEVPGEGTTSVQIVVPMTPAQVVVVITDGDGEPIEGATWTVVSDDGGTTAPGMAPQGLLPGRHMLVLEAPGYRKTRVSITTELARDMAVTRRLLPSRAALRGGRIEILDKVYFESGRGVIKPESDALLEEIAEILAEHPEVERLRIEGHTDSQGPARDNLSLSQARADAVRARLVSLGIAPDRLEAIGYGEERPLEEQERSPADRAANRRVEFHVLDASNPAPPPAPAPEPEPDHAPSTIDNNP